MPTEQSRRSGPRDLILAALIPLGILPAGAIAQQPLTAIDWLEQVPSEDLMPGMVLLEPAVASSASQPDIEVTALDAQAQPIGLVPAQTTGLPVDLWHGSDSGTLARLIARVPVQDSPAMQTLLYTLLLSESRPPGDRSEAETLLLARLDRLLDLGATEPAQTLAHLAEPSANAALFRRWFDSTLLTGHEDDSCATLAGAPYLAPDYGALIFCYARRGDWQTAALTLEAAHALQVLPPARLSLLDRFLSPDVFDGAPPLPLPADPDPLTYRLYEAIGERFPTTALPRAFATADLRDVAGWKAQLEAAERLTRTSALNPNHLLGLYTSQKPAASGGIWDRVSALQRFESALSTGSPDAVAKTLPRAWSAMRQAGLEVAFADLFADRLAAQVLSDPNAADLAWHIRLLAPGYEVAARTPPRNSELNTFLAALALGDPGRARAPSTRAETIASGFATDAAPPDELKRMLDQGLLGEAILRAMALFDQGAQGNDEDLSAALATLRSVGLEDTARRAALQIMLLRRG
jgi:hypothetical protein